MKELRGFQDLLGLEQFVEHGLLGVERALQLGDLFFLFADLVEDDLDRRFRRRRLASYGSSGGGTLGNRLGCLSAVIYASLAFCSGK